MDRGHIACEGNATEACNFFLAQNDDRIRINKQRDARSIANKQSTGEIELIDLEVFNGNGEATDIIVTGEVAEFAMTFDVRSAISKPIIGFGFHTTDFIYLGTVQSLEQLALQELCPGRHRIIFRLTAVPLVPGTYSLRVGVALGDFFQPLFYAEDIKQVTTTLPGSNLAASSSSQEGFISMPGHWRIDASLKSESVV